MVVIVFIKLRIQFIRIHHKSKQIKSGGIYYYYFIISVFPMRVRDGHNYCCVTMTNYVT